MQQTKGPLKVLLSAYACEPGKGSEPGVGWNVARELSSRVELTVITRANNRTTIENSGEAWVRDIHWVFWDPPQWIMFWKKGGRGVQLFYILWQLGVKSVAENILATRGIDIIHHLTFGKYWIPSRLAGLGRPFVFGPVGGGEFSPPGVVSGSSLQGCLAEWFKKLACSFVAIFPLTRRLLHEAAWTFAATSQTATALRNAGVTRLNVLPQSGIRPEDFVGMDVSMEPNHSPHRGLRLVTASRLIHWKAIDLAIESLARLPRELDVRLIILQTGPEQERLKRLVGELGISDRVEFKGRLPTLTDVYKEIANADALVHPALHEAFGQACIEAMALGTPVICLDWAGPGIIVNEATGFAITPGTHAETVESMALAIQRLHAEKSAGRSRSAACRQRATVDFHWATLAEQIVQRYQQIHRTDTPVHAAK
jgi:glycosyltransferase involved in cell wall biosynthesis